MSAYVTTIKELEKEKEASGFKPEYMDGVELYEGYPIRSVNVRIKEGGLPFPNSSEELEFEVITENQFKHGTMLVHYVLTYEQFKESGIKFLDND